MEDKKLDELWSLISRVRDIDRISDDGMTALGSVFGQMRKAITEQQQEIERLKQQISGDTPNCYECGGEIDFDSQYSKFTKEIEETKIANVCKNCF